MDENLLNKYLKLMSTSISDSDLELINLGHSLGLNLVSFAELRSSQENSFIDLIRTRALVRMERDRDNFLINNNSFYAGSIDFMVSDEPDGKKFFLLETNGGSHRGLSIISKAQQKLLFNGYLEAITQAIKLNKRDDNKVFILVGVTVNDALIHEKVIMIEYFRKTLKLKSFSVKIFNTENFEKDYKADIVFLIADYRKLSHTISYSNKWVKYEDEEISVLIGDGIARRLNDEKFMTQIKENYHQINTIIINPIFRITDDKSLTYLASYFSKDILEKYNLRYLIFTKAFNELELIDKLQYLLEKYKRPFVIKPSGGSGGAGIFPVSIDEDSTNIKSIIEESKREFFAKFMKNRNPFPYTIQEKANFSLIDWREKKHTFDLRIYLAQQNEMIIPIGGLARISRGNYFTGLNKQEFVVNLSGYNGQIEVERGVGFSEKNCKLLNLTKDDFVNMFCIGCVLFASMVRNYRRIINFSDWDTIVD